MKIPTLTNKILTFTNLSQRLWLRNKSRQQFNIHHHHVGGILLTHISIV